MRVPPAFLAPKHARRLNVLGVGLSLSAIVAAVFGAMTRDFSGLVTGVPTLLVGIAWAWLLRRPATIAGSKIRWGWLASVPLAALNAGISCAFLLATSKHTAFEAGAMVGGFLLGVTIGAIFWIPALIATLLAFGVPIAWAQRLASRGLAGEERGEWVVGLVTASLGALALVVSLFQHEQPELNLLQPGMDALWSLVFMRTAGLLGVVAGGAAAALAWVRERERRAFVRGVEAGTVPGFAVEATPEGKVLVRVSALGHGYRVADFKEELVLLDDEGQATEVRAHEAALRRADIR